jgi:hypothetical protein
MFLLAGVLMASAVSPRLVASVFALASAPSPSYGHFDTTARHLLLFRGSQVELRPCDPSQNLSTFDGTKAECTYDINHTETPVPFEQRWNCDLFGRALVNKTVDDVRVHCNQTGTSFIVRTCVLSACLRDVPVSNDSAKRLSPADASGDASNVASYYRTCGLLALGIISLSVFGEIFIFHPSNATRDYFREKADMAYRAVLAADLANIRVERAKANAEAELLRQLAPDLTFEPVSRRPIEVNKLKLFLTFLKLIAEDDLARIYAGICWLFNRIPAPAVPSQAQPQPQPQSQPPPQPQAQPEPPSQPQPQLDAQSVGYAELQKMKRDVEELAQHEQHTRRCHLCRKRRSHLYDESTSSEATPPMGSREEALDDFAAVVVRTTTDLDSPASSNSNVNDQLFRCRMLIQSLTGHCWRFITAERERLRLAALNAPASPSSSTPQSVPPTQPESISVPPIQPPPHPESDPEVAADIARTDQFRRDRQTSDALWQIVLLTNNMSGFDLPARNRIVLGLLEKQVKENTKAAEDRFAAFRDKEHDMLTRFLNELEASHDAIKNYSRCGVLSPDTLVRHANDLHVTCYAFVTLRAAQIASVSR